MLFSSCKCVFLFLPLSFLAHDHVIVADRDSNLKLDLKKQAKQLNVDNYIKFKNLFENPCSSLKHEDIFAFTSKNEGLLNIFLR